MQSVLIILIAIAVVAIPVALAYLVLLLVSWGGGRLLAAHRRGLARLQRARERGVI